MEGDGNVNILDVHLLRARWDVSVAYLGSTLLDPGRCPRLDFLVAKATLRLSYHRPRDGATDTFPSHIGTQVHTP